MVNLVGLEINSGMSKKMTNLKAIPNVRRIGSEPFHIDGTKLPDTLLNFWQWSSSEIVGNALRGMLAEYIVANAVGCAHGVRTEWDAYDVLTPDGIRVEVKSGAYVQRWYQRKLSPIQFGIQRTIGWDDSINEYSTEKVRQADAYVFCVLKHQDKDTVDPLNMSQWDFYVLATSVLDEKLGNQKTLSLSRLKRLGPTLVEYSGISEAIRLSVAGGTG